MGGLTPAVILSGGAIAVGLVAISVWLAGSDGREPEFPAEQPAVPTRGWLAGGAAALLLFLLTLPSRPPFAPGGRLGVGVLFGAAAAALVAWGIARRGRATSPTAPAGLLGATLVPAALLMLIYWGDPRDALIGLLLGQTVLLFFSEVWLRVGGEREAASRVGLFLAASAALVAGVSLAIAQYSEFAGPERLAVGQKLWWSVPLLVLAALVIGAVIAAFTARRPALQALIVLVAAAALLALFGTRFPRYWPLFLPPLAGYVTGCLVIALTTTGESEPRRALSALLGAFLVLLLLMVAYRLRTGLGIALAALGFAGAAAALLPSLSAPAASLASVSGLQVLALAALFRLFYASQDLEATSIYLTAHYALIGLIAGCLIPLGMGLLAVAAGPEEVSDSDSGAERSAVGGRWSVVGGPMWVWRAALAQGCATVALPLAMLLLWGLKAAAGLLLGLTVGQAFLLALLLLEPDARGTAGRAAMIAPAVPVLLLAVVALQLLAPLAPFTQDLTRVQRAAGLLALAALGLPWLFWQRKQAGVNE